MMNNGNRQGWQECKLGEIATYVTGKLNSNAAVANGDYPFFTCSPETLRIDNYAFDREALILAGNNADGVFSLKYYNGKFNAYQRTYIISVIDDKKTDYKFLFYSLRTQLLNLETISHGTATKYLTLPILNDIPVILPSLAEQRAIAGVLSSLDDKIDLLHRQNKTLEGMAEALWRMMFVEESEWTWKIGAIKDIVDILSGFDFKSSVFVDNGKYRLLTIKNVQDGYLDLSRADYLEAIPEGVPDYCVLQNGDILLSLTGNVGRCCLVTEEHLLLNQRVAKLQARNTRDSAFAYVMFRQPSMRSSLEELAKGTAQANLSPIETANYEIRIPPDELFEEYSKKATPLTKKVLNNWIQIRSLSRLRDTLLPKLMSGEVRVRL